MLHGGHLREKPGRRASSGIAIHLNPAIVEKSRNDSFSSIKRDRRHFGIHTFRNESETTFYHISLFQSNLSGACLLDQMIFLFSPKGPRILYELTSWFLFDLSYCYCSMLSKAKTS